MKAINEAYQWAIKNPPQSRAGTRPAASSPQSGPVCPEHHQPSVRQCRRCQTPICLGCKGFRQSLCNRHYEVARTRLARGRALKEWAPLIILVAVMRTLDLPGLYIGLGVLVYLGWLGFRFLMVRRWFGCLALLLLPYSLVLAGIWSLIESLREWNGSDPSQKVGRS